ncbi:MAG TPA: hypothetical protein VGQ20_12875 [Acidimicrobiales bacterium]|nr:hypothetical protein [Acidimicrobiales bacterium]
MNLWTISVFAPILVLVGALGFVVPERRSMTSGAPAYNVFHLGFGTLGIVLAIAGNDAGIRAFNLGFGAIDLYQFAANRFGWPPKAQFRWKPADDVLHVVIGVALVLIGGVGSS